MADQSSSRTPADVASLAESAGPTLTVSAPGDHGATVPSQPTPSKAGATRTETTPVAATSATAHAPWDGILVKIRSRLSQLSFALLSVQTLEAEKVGWGAATGAAAAASSAAASSSRSSVASGSASALLTARASILKHRAELVVLLESMVECGKSIPACDPEVLRLHDGAASEATEPAGAAGTRGPDAAAGAAAPGVGREDDEESWDAFCARCGSGDDSEENPILLCDHQGCGRGFHRMCCSEPMPLEALEDEDEPWVCDYCACLAEALSNIVEVDSDMDRDSVPELIGALRAAATSEAAGGAAGGGEAGADEVDEMALLRRIAISAASGQPAAPGEDGADGEGRRRHAVDYALLNALMHGDGMDALEREDGDYESDEDDSEDDEAEESSGGEAEDEDEFDVVKGDGTASAGAAGTGRRPTRRAAAAARSLIREELARMQRAQAAKEAAAAAGTAESTAAGAASAAAAGEEDEEDDESYASGSDAE